VPGVSCLKSFGVKGQQVLTSPSGKVSRFPLAAICLGDCPTMRTLLGYLVLLVTFGRPAHAQNCPQIATNLRIDPTQTIGGSSNSIIGGKPYPIVQVTFT